jgi:hypothetical protein
MTKRDVPSFLTKSGDSLIFNEDGEFIFYVPEIYFDRGDALITGEYVNIIGIMDYAIFDKNGKSKGLKRFYFPTVFLTKPYQMDKMKNVKLTSSQKAKDYRLLRYKKGDVIVVSTKVPQNPAYIEDFYRIFLAGKLPNTIPYDKLQEYMIDNAAYNGESYGVSMQIFGILIGVMARDPNNPNKAFRHTKWTDPTAYNFLPITEVPKYISPSQSITSQNWDNAIVGAIMNPTDTESPMEKLLMG